MTQTPTKQQPQPPQARAHFVVPAKHPMVTVLGSGDALLRVIEQAFPAVDLAARVGRIGGSAPAVFNAVKSSPNAHLALGPWHHGQANGPATAPS